MNLLRIFSITFLAVFITVSQTGRADSEQYGNWNLKYFVSENKDQFCSLDSVRSDGGSFSLAVSRYVGLQLIIFADFSGPTIIDKNVGTVRLKFDSIELNYPGQFLGKLVAVGLGSMPKGTRDAFIRDFRTKSKIYYRGASVKGYRKKTVSASLKGSSRAVDALVACVKKNFG